MDVDTALIDVISALLGANLLGIYAYDTALEAAPGTLALLIVTTRDLTADVKYGLTQTLLRHSTETAPLDVLVVREADLVAQPSVLVQLHYSERDRQMLAGEVGSIAWLKWPDGPTGSVDRSELIARVQHAGRPLPEVIGETTPTPPAQPHRLSDTTRQLPLE